MFCPQCSEAVEPGAAFCGNCGQALDLPMPLPPAPFGPPSAVEADPAAVSLPAYAVADPARQRGETRAMVGLIIAVLAIPAAAVPLLGWVLAIAGLILATTTRRMLQRKLMPNLAIAFSSLGLVLSAGVYVYVTQVQTKTKPAEVLTAQSGTDSESLATSRPVSALVETPCYSVSVVGLDMADNAKGSCNVKLYDAVTLGESNRALVVDAVKQGEITSANFVETSKALVDTYLAASLPGFAMVTQQTTVFAGSKAYIIEAKNTATTTSMQLAIVLHTSTNGENLFVIAYARNGAPANLADVAQAWEWK